MTLTHTVHGQHDRLSSSFKDGNSRQEITGKSRSLKRSKTVYDLIIYSRPGPSVPRTVHWVAGEWKRGSRAEAEAVAAT